MENQKKLLVQNFDSFLRKLQFFKLFPKKTFLNLSDISLECNYYNKQLYKDLVVDVAIKCLKILQILKPAVKIQIEAVLKKLEFVSAILHFGSNDINSDEFNMNFFNHLQDWTNCASGVPFLFRFDKIDEKLDSFVAQLIDKFKPSNLELAESYLAALMALNPSSDQEPDVSLKRIAGTRFLEIIVENLDGFDEIIQHELAFLISFLINPPLKRAEDVKIELEHEDCPVDIRRKYAHGLFDVGSLREDAAGLIYSLCASNSKEDITTKESRTLLHDSVRKIDKFEDRISEIHRASTWNNFPRTNVVGFLESFFGDVKEKLKCEVALTTYEKHQLMIVKEELLFFKSLVMDAFEEQEENEDLRTQVIEMAYRVEYVIDSCFFCDRTRYWHKSICLSKIAEETRVLKAKLNTHPQMCKMEVVGKRRNSGGGFTPARANNTTRVDDVVVGFEDETKNIINCLIRRLPHNERDVVTIVGMPGQGKTTLAKKLYNHPEVRPHFQKCAWRCISQEYKIKDLLTDILKQVYPDGDEDDICSKSHEDLAVMLYRSLKGRTYLIVLDDIWDIGAWNELKASFPDDRNGSRIMFTSRIHKVAMEAKSDCSLHELHQLSFDDSWKLLQLKLSYGDSFPVDLVDIGKHIADGCNGLPLAIVVIAGLLKKLDDNLNSWEQVAGSLNSNVAKEGCMDILQLSYMHLPDYLRPCFLYVAAFREDDSFIAKRLTRYWIAEGFIQKHKSKSLEDVANEYLMDLIGRSLLFVAKRSSRYGIKRCRVHDLVRQLCLEKAKVENFFLVQNTTSDNHSSNTMQQSYRLCFQTKSLPSFELEHGSPTVRTLLFSESIVNPQPPFFFIWFKLLRTLDLINIEIHYNIDAITQLIHLRYLALQGVFSVPPSIVNLSRLEFLQLCVSLCPIPRAIWNMRSLQHLYLRDSYLQDKDDLLGEYFQLDNLETYSSRGTCFEEELKWQLRRIPNVRKLRVRLDFCIRLSMYLSKLESLRLEFSKMRKLSPIEFDFPSTLRKLTLKNASLSSSMMFTIGKMPNLEVLKLLYVRFEDQRWDVQEDDEFLNLKYLELLESDIEQWNAPTDSFLQLQQLILKSCYFLTEIPSALGSVSTLELIEVLRCNYEVASSVDEIVAEQQDLRDVDLQITTDYLDAPMLDVLIRIYRLGSWQVSSCLLDFKQSLGS